MGATASIPLGQCKCLRLLLKITFSKAGEAVGLCPNAGLLPDQHSCLVLDLDLDHGPMLCSTSRALVLHMAVGGDMASASADPWPLHGPEPTSQVLP